MVPARKRVRRLSTNGTRNSADGKRLKRTGYPVATSIRPIGCLDDRVYGTAFPISQDSAFLEPRESVNGYRVGHVFGFGCIHVPCIVSVAVSGLFC